MGEHDPLLRDPRQRVSPRAPLVWAAVAVGQALVLAAALVLVSGPWRWVSIPAWAWVLDAVVCSAYVVVMPTFRYRTHRWETTETAVYTQTGWLTRDRRVAPMSRVQTVDFSQGPVSRLLGLAGVTVTTASAAGPLRIEGLAHDVATRLVAELTRRTEAEPGDAT
ncbi:MAG: PH domain-containing protein [Marmoricola sp.]